MKSIIFSLINTLLMSWFVCWFDTNIAGPWLKVNPNYSFVMAMTYIVLLFITCVVGVSLGDKLFKQRRWK